MNRYTGSAAGNRIPRTFGELRQSRIRSEHAHRVLDATVMWLDEHRIRTDFPQLKELSWTELSRWVLAQGALLSPVQALANEVNGPVRVLPEPVSCQRLPRYGRAAIVEARAPDGTKVGLLDLKGVGVAADRHPAPTLDCDGLMFAPAAVCELFFELLIASLASRFDPMLRTNPTYAILWLGFCGRSGAEGGQWLPAVQMVRRAHIRPLNNDDLPLNHRRSYLPHLACELFLRQFGVTSTSPPSRLNVTTDGDFALITYGGKPSLTIPLTWMHRLYSNDITDREFDCNNIQMCRRTNEESITLYDFGHYGLKGSFTRPLVQLVQNAPLNWGECIDPNNLAYVGGIAGGADGMGVFSRSELPAETRRWFDLEQCVFSVSRYLGFELSYRFWTGEDDPAGVMAAVAAAVSAATDEIAHRCTSTEIKRVRDIVAELDAE